jgi:uncharacterized protein YbjT (DUF2867 family)
VNVSVLGATGRTGKRIVPLLTAADHHVRAVVRDRDGAIAVARAARDSGIRRFVQISPATGNRAFDLTAGTLSIPEALARLADYGG